MDNVPAEKPPPPPAPPAPAAPPAPSPAPRAAVNPHERRDFFNDAMRDLLLPFATIIENRINPILNALEQLPDQAQRLADSNFGLGGHGGLDQLHDPHPDLHLPQSPAQSPFPERTLRPPGASTDGQFETLCTRCGDCVKACPAAAIRLDSNALIADGFPYIVADTQPCVVCDSLACMKSCPTGALKLVDRLQIKMGTAVVHHADCLRDHGEACTLCLDVCPISDGSDHQLSALFVSPLSGQVRVRKNICIGCGLCESRCPTEPRAITVTPYNPPIDPIVA